jgi:N-acetylneuraminic acid mutarotase
VAASGGRLIVAGGTVGVAASRDILAFDPARGAVRRIGRLPSALTHAAAAALHGSVYVFGGRGAELTSQRRSILAIEPASGRVRRAGSLPAALSDMGATADGQGVLLVGGKDAGGTVHDEVWSVR